jgi:hypothetical protein
MLNMARRRTLACGLPALQVRRTSDTSDCFWHSHRPATPRDANFGYLGRPPARCVRGSNVAILMTMCPARAGEGATGLREGRLQQ